LGFDRMMYLQVLGGLALLLGGAEFLVRGAVGLAKRMGVSPLVVGMTVVAMGTSAPELVVSLNAALTGAPGIALGNLVGSNIANVLLILGAVGLVMAFAAKPQPRQRDALVLVGSSLLFAVLCWRGTIGLWQGLILLAAFFGFLGHSFWHEIRDDGVEAKERIEEVHELETMAGLAALTWLAVIGGLAAILYGADLLVGGGVALARTYGVPEEVIGLTLIAVGTSLPELAASVVAAVRGHADVALGNVVGSNLFNVLGVVGVVAVTTPLPVAEQIQDFDIWVMLGSTVLVVPLLMGRWRFSVGEGVVFLFAYAAYIGVQLYGVSGLLARIGGS
jgi:cation:H+ antiporter